MISRFISMSSASKIKFQSHPVSLEPPRLGQHPLRTAGPWVRLGQKQMLSHCPGRNAHGGAYGALVSQLRFCTGPHALAR